MTDRTKTLMGLDKWYVDLHRECLEESRARVYRSADGTLGKQVPVADCYVSHVPADGEDDAEDDENHKIDRKNEQWRNLVLLTHAPILLDAIQRVLWDLQEIVDGEMHGERPRWKSSEERHRELNAALNTDAGHPVWCKLCELQRELQDAYDEATDVESF